VVIFEALGSEKIGCAVLALPMCPTLFHLVVYSITGSTVSPLDPGIRLFNGYGAAALVRVCGNLGVMMRQPTLDSTHVKRDCASALGLTRWPPAASMGHDLRHIERYIWATRWGLHKSLERMNNLVFKK